MEVGKCSISDGAGLCAPKPQVCTDEDDPVCGCDGETYGNRCEAAAVGISIEREGPCYADIIAADDAVNSTSAGAADSQ